MATSQRTSFLCAFVLAYLAITQCGHNSTLTRSAGGVSSSRCSAVLDLEQQMISPSRREIVHQGMVIEELNSDYHDRVP